MMGVGLVGSHRLLITTHHRAFVHAERDVVLDEGRGLYYGATWGPRTGLVYVAARNLEADQGTLILAYGGKLDLVAETFLPEVRRVHQILWWDGIVYICDTGHDRVVAWDGEALKVVYEATDTMLDYSHVNGIWCDGKRFWVSELYARRLRAFDLEWNLVRDIPTEYGVHDVYREKRAVYTCASDRGCLARLAPEPMFVDVACGEYTYARGLARTRDRWYVGLSSVSKRSDRGDGGCRVVVLDDSMERMGEIRFEGTGGLQTLRAMDGIDCAHNRIPCPA